MRVGVGVGVGVGVSMGVDVCGYVCVCLCVCVCTRTCVFVCMYHNSMCTFIHVRLWGIFNVDVCVLFVCVHVFVCR